MLVFPLLGPLLGAIQFTKRAEEYEKGKSFFWDSKKHSVDGCRVQPELAPRWSGPGQLAAGTTEEEEGEEKEEEAGFRQRQAISLTQSV